MAKAISVTADDLASGLSLTLNMVDRRPSDSTRAASTNRGAHRGRRGGKGTTSHASKKPVGGGSGQRPIHQAQGMPARGRMDGGRLETSNPVRPAHRGRGPRHQAKRAPVCHGTGEGISEVSNPKPSHRPKSGGQRPAYRAPKNDDMGKATKCAHPSTPGDQSLMHQTQTRQPEYKGTSQMVLETRTTVVTRIRVANSRK